MDVREPVVESPVVGDIVDEEGAILWYTGGLNRREIYAEDLAIGMSVGEINRPSCQLSAPTYGHSSVQCIPPVPHPRSSTLSTSSLFSGARYSPPSSMIYHMRCCSSSLSFSSSSFGNEYSAPSIAWYRLPRCHRKLVVEEFRLASMLDVSSPSAESVSVVSFCSNEERSR